MRIFVSKMAILSLVAGFGGSFTSIPQDAAAQGSEHYDEPLAVPTVPGGVGSESQKKAGVEQKTVTIDEQYRALLKDWERFQAIRKQQPGNHNVLQRELGRLERHFAALHGSVAPRPAEPVDQAGAVVPAKAGESLTPSGQDVAVPPGGPVQSVHTPPAEADVQRFIDALDKTHLPGKPLSGASLDSRTLSHVPLRWIVELTDMATAESENISQMLKQSAVDESEIERAIHRLEVLVLRIDKPPPETPPSKPSTTQRSGDW